MKNIVEENIKLEIQELEKAQKIPQTKMKISDLKPSS